MKYLIVPLLALLVICQSSDDETFAFFKESLEQADLTIQDQIGAKYSIAEAAMQEEPKKNRKYKVIIDSIRSISQRVLGEIDNQLNTKKDKSIKTGKLLVFLNEFDAMIDSLSKNKSIYSGFINRTWNNFQINSDYHSKNELKLLKNKVLNTSYWAVYEYVVKMNGPVLKPNKLKIAVVPESKYLHPNETYKANITLMAYDTAENIIVEIDNKVLEVKNGIAFYADSSTLQPRIVRKNGVLKLLERYTDIYRLYPFTIKYQIIEQ